VTRPGPRLPGGRFGHPGPPVGQPSTATLATSRQGQGRCE